MADTIRVAVTGAAGQVAYAMLGRLASGEVFGPGRKVVLQLLEIPQAMAANAAKDVRVLIVGNPCNTNCLVAYSNGRSIPAERWAAMTRLDHNRARSALARKAGVANAEVTCVTIWGNHSNTQYPDFAN